MTAPMHGMQRSEPTPGDATSILSCLPASAPSLLHRPPARNCPPMNRTILRPSGAALLAILVAALTAMASDAHAQRPADSAAAAVPAGSITLGDAARLAARRGATVEVANLRVGQAAARARQSRSALLPDVAALASLNGRTFNTATMGIDFPTEPGTPPLFDPNGEVLGPVNTGDIRGRVTAPLLDLAALGRYRSAQAATEAAGTEIASAAQQSAAQAAIAYVRLQRAQAQLTARAADSTLAADLLQVARDQLAAGIGVRLDVTRAEAQVAATRAQLIAARNARDRAELDLRRAMDLPLDTPLSLSDSLGGAAEPVPGVEAAVGAALSGRPELRAFDAQLAVLRQQMLATRAERLPAISLFVDDGFIGKSPSHLLNTYTWGLQLSVPVFEGFRREGRLEEQQAQLREVEVRRRDLEQQVAADVRGALLDLSSAMEQVDAGRERLRLAEQEVEQARERFMAGLSGNSDVINASLSLTGARTQLNDALAAYQAARVALARAQGDVTALR